MNTLFSMSVIMAALLCACSHDDEITLRCKEVSLTSWLRCEGGDRIVRDRLLSPNEFRSPPPGWPAQKPGQSNLFELLDVDPGENEIGNYIIVSPPTSLSRLLELCQSPESPEAKRVRIVLVSRTSRIHRPWSRASDW